MNKNLIEKLYCLSFSLKEASAKVIAELTETFQQALNFSKVLVYGKGANGLYLVAVSPVPGLSYSYLCGLKNCLSFNLESHTGKKVGELYIILKKKSALSASQRNIVKAFTIQLGGLLDQLLSNNGGDSQIRMAKELNRYKYLLARDKLTGLYNRYHFEESINFLESNGIHPVSIIMIDVDGLKIINDNLGHRYGDEALKIAADMFKKTFRSEDIVARIGGDEFAALLPAATQDIAEGRCKLLSRALEKYNKFNKFPPLSFSFGYAASGGTIRPLRNVLEEADTKMYEQKCKNRLKVDNYLRICCLPFRSLAVENTAGNSMSQSQ